MTFHSVGDVPLPHDLRHLTTTPSLLERILVWLTEHSFQTLSLQELFDHLESGAQVPRKSVVLTFDDGYLDNWVFVHPLLKRHGHRGVIFVSGGFVQEAESPRPTLEDVWQGKLAREELHSLGYCSWAELRAMSDAGTLEVQSHLMSHTWYPVGPKIVGFHSPQKPWYVGYWNAEPSRKPHWLDLSAEEIAEVVPWGSPIYESGRSHIARRCKPDPSLARDLTQHVADRGGKGFFERPDWESRLREVASASAPASPELERREEFLRRVERECVESQSLIEERLAGWRPRFMAWPGGAWDETVLEIAMQTYDATLTADPGVTCRGQRTDTIHRRFFEQRSHQLLGTDWPSLIHFKGRLQRQRGLRFYALHTFLARKTIEIGTWAMRGSR